MSTASRDRFQTTDLFPARHIGPSPAEIERMLQALGLGSLDELIAQTIPAAIRLNRPLALDGPRGEHEALDELRAIARRNQTFRSLIGMGYHDTQTPPVIQRGVFENPGWYTQYTPYQAEISQGRLEALLNFQTMIADLTGLPMANASLLDEATAAAEAMHLCRAVCDDADNRPRFFVARGCHPQTIAVVQTRARPLGITIEVGDPFEADFARGDCFGLLLQYPATDGRVVDYAALTEKARAAGVRVAVAADLLALTLLRPPGEWGADVCVGSAQRFGVPLGLGGPHAAFMSTRDEFKRQLPGRIIGVSRDATGRPAFRLAIQTREQHIRREKATSNICTAQVLLAVMAGMYAVYHGPDGLRQIAERIRGLTALLAAGLQNAPGVSLPAAPFFDTLALKCADAKRADEIQSRAVARGINLRRLDPAQLCIALDECSTLSEVETLLDVCGAPPVKHDHPTPPLPAPFARTSAYLTHEVFHRYRCEHELLRYVKRLESRDLSLTTSNIPLGSCTMKLNAAAEMFPVSWPEFARLHPFAPAGQWTGYAEMFRQLEQWLAEITGFAAVSLQPNAGSQGEFAGLLAIRGYHESRAGGAAARNVCLIPVSAHGTNPASAVLAGFRVVPVRCDAAGNVELADLRAKAESHAAELGALMITYPSTHGVFEEDVREICAVVHRHGGLVYMDGANMNAQVGLCRPADVGADVCHLNLHKTFCIPHGGGGPGMGPIAVSRDLAPFLPQHPDFSPGGGTPAPTDAPQSAFAPGPVSAAPYGSPSILPISWMYIRMMGASGLKLATEVAILNANYMARRLQDHYPVLYRGRQGRVAHEFILDCRELEDSAGVRVEDIAKRLMDYGFHAPTMSWPVPGTLMIEPTESESLAELDRLCDALISIREEIRQIEQGRLPREDNPLRNAPHTAAMVTADEWSHPYSRSVAAFPAPWVRAHKFWPHVARVDNVWGDRNLMCTCPPMESYAAAAS